MIGLPRPVRQQSFAQSRPSRLGISVIVVVGVALLGVSVIVGIVEQNLSLDLGAARITTVPSSTVSGSASSAPRVGPYKLGSLPLDSVRPGLTWDAQGWLAYDHLDHSFYVAVAPSSVDIISGNFTQVGTVVPVGTDPFGVAYDNATGTIFVTNTGSNNVSALKGNQSAPVASIPVGEGPLGIAYDPVDGDLYVANNGSDSVSIFSGTTFALVSNVSVGTNPLGIAADPVTGKVFVANHGSANVSVISPTTDQIVATVPVGRQPFGVAIDTSNSGVYVTDEGSNAVSVLSDQTDLLVATIDVSNPDSCCGIDLQGIAYDSGDGLIWAGAGFVTIVVIAPVSESVLQVLNFDPSGVAYDPDTGDICVTNSANATFECAQFLAYVAPPPTITFWETGLPVGTSWSVTLGSVTWEAQTPTDNISFFATFGTYNFTIGSIPGYPANPSQGAVTIQNAQVRQTILFAPVGSFFPVLLVESGLPTGTLWTAVLGNFSASSEVTTIGFLVLNGTYKYAAKPVGTYTVSRPGTLTVNGMGVVVAVEYAPLSYSYVFVENGLPLGIAWSLSAIDSSTAATVLGNSTSSNLTMHLSNGTYTLAASDPPGCSVEISSDQLTVAGPNSITPAVTFSCSSATPTPSWVFLLAGAVAGVLVTVIVSLLVSFRRVSKGASPPQSDPSGPKP
jgi:YVTN family beta-propeller protein